MASEVYRQVKAAFRNLNPEQIAETARRPLSIGLMAADSAGLAAMEDALMPPPISRARRFEVVHMLHRVGQPGAANHFDLVLCDEELLCPPEAFCFQRGQPLLMVREILDCRSDLALPLARNFCPFRRPVIGRLIRTIARENATFALMTALPDVIPSLVELPWAVGEFASDTAFLTMNQVRMAFLIAAASDHDPGFREQRGHIAALVGGAFGWRALARELIGKIPFGGGLIPKAAIAYAGTYTVGLGLERFYRLGYGLTRAERRTAYEDALEKGKQIVGALLESAKARETA